MRTPGSPLIRVTTILDKWVWPTRKPADLTVDPTDLVGGPHDLLKTFRRFPNRPYPELPQDLVCRTRHRWILNKKINGYGKRCNLDLGILVITSQESGKRPCPLANIRQTRQPLYHHVILEQSTPTTGRRVLLSEGPS
jgi:hypothetical protein